MKILESQLENYENHENHIIPNEKQDNHANLRISLENKSKKTYSTGQIINYSSLTIKKIFDPNFGNFINNFYIVRKKNKTSKFKI